jgi:outer membrane protein assembly factor BamB
MKNSKLLLIVAALTVLLVGSLLVVGFHIINIANQPSNVEADSYLLQYEWPQFQGDPSSTHFSAGPAPEAPDFLWKTNITGVQSYVTAFNGKVFATTKTSVFALDRENGSILWNTTVPAPGQWPAVYKIDDTHLVVGNSSLDIDTGCVLWTSANFSASFSPFFVANVYSPEEKMFYVKTGSYVQGWDFSDPSNPPTLSWESYDAGGGLVGSGIQYGDGKVFPGSYDPHQMAFDAKTGAVLWDTETKTPMVFSGSYYQGKFFRGGSHDNTMYCFDATTGKILWTYSPESADGYFSVGPAAAYGMVYELNKDGYLYALDVNTGELVWKYKGPGPLIFPGNPVVADGKIYATTGQTASYTGQQSESEFACLDAYTGQLIWKLPIEAFAPRESIALAYGNMYLIPGDVTTSVDTESGEEYATVNQVWAIGTRSWPMFRHDPAHSATGQSGPANLILRWNFTTEGAVISSPSVADGRVYFGSQDKNIYALDARTGDFIWKFATSGRLKSSPAVVDGRVYLGPDDGTIYCLDAYTGSLLWSKGAGGFIQTNFAAAAVLQSSPTVVGSKVYVGSLDTNVYCLEADDGNVNWTYKTKGYITSSPAVVDGAVYIISQEPDSGVLYKLDAVNGDLIWKREIPYQQISMGGTDIHMSPTVGDGMVFAASSTKEYYGINAATGNIEWTYRNDAAGELIVCSPAYKDGKLFIVDHFSIVCLDAKNGKTVWNNYLGEELYVSPSYADGKLYVVTDQRSVYILNATSGEKLANFGTSSNSYSSPTIYEGRVYVGDNDWNVYCLAESPAIQSNLTMELTKPKVGVGESVEGFGYLSPGYPNETILLSFLKPDGSAIDLQAVTSYKGVFNFTYTPDVAGNWTVAAQWHSDKGYYTSAYGEVPVEVSSEGNLTAGYVAAAVIVIVIVIVGIAIFFYMKPPKTIKP